MGRILYILFAVFVVVYIVGAVWNSLYDPIQTVTAMHVVAEDTIETEGFVVRNEKVLDAEVSGVIELKVAEGERASKGDPIANVYASKGDLEKVHKKEEINARIDRLKVLESQGNEIVDLKSVDTSIVKMSQELSSYLETNQYSKMPQVIDSIKNKTLSREYVYRDKDDLKSVIASLEKERDAIGSVKIVDVVYATTPGYYSAVCDGFESELVCSGIESLTPGKFNELFNAEEKAPESGAMGKIVTEFYWNYAIVVSQEEAQRIRVGKSAKINFENPAYPAVDAIVQWKSQPEDGNVCVVFRIDEHVGDFTDARKLKASVVIKSYEGLKVPREALRMNEDGTQGVYCLVDSQVKFKPVETIFEKDSYYIVAYDSTNTKGLLLYDEIVISAKELEHRKMVK